MLGDCRQTVTVVRSLSRAGYEVVLGTDDPVSSTALSRHVSRVWRYGDAAGPQFRAQLRSFLEAERPAYVFPVAETPLRSVVEAPESLLSLARWAMPNAGTVRRCFDKSLLYRITLSLGIPTVPWEEHGPAELWRSRAREMGFPVVVKRKDSALKAGGKKALIFYSAQAFDAFVEALHLERDPATLLLQKHASGERHNCHVAAEGGKLVAYFQQKVLRTDELNGTGLGVEGVSVAPSPALHAYCKLLLARLAYHGIGCIQFLVDERTGQTAFLEFNPRMDSTAALPYRLGVDFPLLAMQLAEGARPNAVRSPRYRAGRRYQWLFGELMHWQDCLRRGQQTPAELARWAIAMLRASVTSHHLTWEWSDPVPTLHMYWKRLRRSFGRGLARAPRMGARTLAK